MSRIDYDTIKEKFKSYIQMWNTDWNAYDVEPLKKIFDPDVFFSTSTSLTMPNGAQDSIYGVYDFLKYFPRTDILQRSIYNYVCRICKDEAYLYAEIPCTAFNLNDQLDFYEFTAMVTCTWKKLTDGWKIVDMRHEIVGERGTLKSYFEKFWHFEKEDNFGHHAGESGTMFLSSGTNTDFSRLPVIRGEGDSPWLNVPEAENILTEEEKIKEALTKYFFGEEHNSFVHCYEALSKDYGAYSYFGTDGHTRKDTVNNLSAARQTKKYVITPVKYNSIEIKENRAYVLAQRVRGLRQNSREYVYTKENMDIEHTCARLELELVKENGDWKLAFLKSYKGLYEGKKWDSEDLYGDEC